MISVVIPSFNRGSTIARAVKSVLMQTYRELEVIVVDDCSTDDTERVLSKINDSRLKYIKLPENKGANFARNKGIDVSKGQYIAFQDSDDIWKKDKLQKQLTFMKQGNYDVSFTSMMQHHKQKKIKFPKINDRQKKNLLSRALYGNIMSTQTIMAKRSVLLKEKFDPTIERFQDWDLAIRLLQNYEVGFLDESLVDVFISDDSISKSNQKAIRSLKRIMSKYEELFSPHKVKLSNNLHLLMYATQTGNRKIVKEIIKRNWFDCKDIITFLSLMVGPDINIRVVNFLKKCKSVIR